METHRESGARQAASPLGSNGQSVTISRAARLPRLLERQAFISSRPPLRGKSPPTNSARTVGRGFVVARAARSSIHFAVERA